MTRKHTRESVESGENWKSGKGTAATNTAPEEGNGMDGEADDIAIEVDEQTAERAADLAWSFGEASNDVVRQCLRYGLRNYEQALGLDCEN